MLGISRVAVWKQVRRLRTLGYGIESEPRLGYRLASVPDEPLPWEVTEGLGTSLIGTRAFYLDVAESTQDEAARLSADPANAGALVVARRQTGGRGRGGRRWLSPPGGISLSVILPTGIGVQEATLLPAASSLALAAAVEGTVGVSPSLKWPNDLLLRGRKVAGVLVEMSVESNRIGSIVVGAGVNFDVDARRLGRDLGEGARAASLEGRRRGASRVALVRWFLAELESAYGMLVGGGASGIVSGWSARSSTLGRRVEIETGSGRVSGTAVRMDPDGALVVSSGGNMRRVVAGDVVHGR